MLPGVTNTSLYDEQIETSECHGRPDRRRSSERQFVLPRSSCACCVPTSHYFISRPAWSGRSAGSRCCG